MKSPLRILHIEDNANDAELVRELLARDGIELEVIRVERREQCTAVLKQGGFDLILCDYNLPSFDGLAALALAKESHPHTPFIFVSGAIGEERAIESLKRGATDYILKDRLSRLAPAVRRAMQEVEERAERKKLEEQLLHAQKMETIGTLAGGIAHDFNNILGILLGYVSLMKRGRIEPEKFAAAIDVMMKSIDRGATLVRQLLTFARKSEVLFEPVNMNSTVEEVGRMCSETFPRQIAFALHLGKDVPGIIADQNQLHQALLNLCVNARDAMPGSGTVSLSTDVVGLTEVRKFVPDAAEDRYVCVSVTDTGCGMDKATQARIFEPFFTTKGVGQGTGLGLAMVYGMINSHGGAITVDSEPDRGTTFRLWFPTQAAGGKTVNFEADVQEELRGGDETILFLEDEETLVELVRTMLQAQGYKVLVAKDGMEGIDLFRKHASQIALVLADLSLPKLGGWEAFQTMREIKPSIVSIVATGYIDARSRSEMLKGGAKYVIQKPYVPNQILRAIRETLDSEVMSV